MKKSVCLYLQVHQPTRLRLYRFFDIGKDSHYYDDFANRTAVRKVAQRCYFPMNEILLECIKSCKGRFKVAFSISGSALEQFDRYAPEVLDSFRSLSETGCVEFLCETYNHSLASLVSEDEFARQVKHHAEAVEEYFGVKPTAFRNTELIYSDQIGRLVSSMGFKTMLTEGARHIMAWESPNYVYNNDFTPDLKLLLRNYSLSDDIAIRFSNRAWSEWPLTAEKYVDWLRSTDGCLLNLFMDYKTFGDYHNAGSGIMEFMKALPSKLLDDGGFEFVTPSEAAGKYDSVGDLSVPESISWSDEERDVTAWLGNELQQDAFNKLYGLEEKLAILDDDMLWSDFGHLQESDHLHYMDTKFFSDGQMQAGYNPYTTPYEAFINYMNVLNDFTIRVNNAIEERQ